MSKFEDNIDIEKAKGYVWINAGFGSDPYNARGSELEKLVDFYTNPKVSPAETISYISLNGSINYITKKHISTLAYFGPEVAALLIEHEAEESIKGN